MPGVSDGRIRRKSRVCASDRRGLAVIIGEKFALCGVHAAGGAFAGLRHRGGLHRDLNTPLAGAVFGVEVLVLQYRRWVYLIPTLMTSFITWGIARAADVSYIDFHGHFTGGETEAGSRPGLHLAHRLTAASESRRDCFCSDAHRQTVLLRAQNHHKGF